MQTCTHPGCAGRPTGAGGDPGGGGGGGGGEDGWHSFNPAQPVKNIPVPAVRACAAVKATFQFAAVFDWIKDMDMFGPVGAPEACRGSIPPGAAIIHHVPPALLNGSVTIQ